MAMLIIKLAFNGLLIFNICFTIIHVAIAAITGNLWDMAFFCFMSAINSANIVQFWRAL